MKNLSIEDFLTASEELDFSSLDVATYLPMPTDEFKALYELSIANGEISDVVEVCLEDEDQAYVVGFIMNGRVYLAPDWFNRIHEAKVGKKH